MPISNSSIKRNINIIFIISAIGLTISLFNSTGAKAAGYMIVIICQAMWLVDLEQSVICLKNTKIRLHATSNSACHKYKTFRRPN